MPSPLHPAVVHFPLVLAVLLPFLTLAALVAARRPGFGRAPWAVIAVFAALLPLTAWAAVGTGSKQGEIVENVVPETALEGHEEAAEGFLAASAVLAVIALAGLVPGGTGRVARWVTVPASVVILALAVRVGDSGGQLVYTHGAAAAYARDAGGAPTGTAATRSGTAAARKEEGENEDEDEERRR